MKSGPRFITIEANSKSYCREAQNPMFSFKTMKRETMVNIINGILSLIVLALSVEMFKAWINQAEQLVQISTLFFLSSAVYRFIRAFLLRDNSKVDFIRDIIGGCLLLAGTILLRISSDGSSNMTTIGILYFLSILADRIASVIKNRKPINILLNVLMIVALFLLGQSVIVIVLVNIVHALREILSIAYSQMKIDIFWKVVRKTKIIAFSLVLPILEEGIPDFTSALWYCFAIISTIGFGDVAAVSLLGRLLSAILGICGLVVVSVVLSIVVNFYNETKDMDD